MSTNDNDGHDTSITEFNRDDKDKTEANREDVAVAYHDNPSCDDMETSTPGSNQEPSNRNYYRSFDDYLENPPTADVSESPDDNDDEDACHDNSEDESYNSNPGYDNDHIVESSKTERDKASYDAQIDENA